VFKRNTLKCIAQIICVLFSFFIYLLLLFFLHLFLFKDVEDDITKLVNSKAKRSSRRRLPMVWNLKAPVLKKYQTDDVDLMISLENNARYRGGINGNDMGLGKTGNFVAIYFFCFNIIST